MVEESSLAFCGTVGKTTAINEAYFRQEWLSTYTSKVEKRGWGKDFLCCQLLKTEPAFVENVGEFKAQVTKIQGHNKEMYRLIHLTSRYLEGDGCWGAFTTLLHKILNILKACFGCSDWQEAVCIFQKYMNESMLEECKEISPKHDVRVFTEFYQLSRAVEKKAECYLKAFFDAASQMNQLQKKYPNDHWRNVKNEDLQASIRQIHLYLESIQESIMPEKEYGALVRAVEQKNSKR